MPFHILHIQRYYDMIYKENAFSIAGCVRCRFLGLKCTDIVSTFIAPLALGACAAEVLKLALDNRDVWRPAVGEAHLCHIVEAALVLLALTLVPVAWRLRRRAIALGGPAPKNYVLRYAQAAAATVRGSTEASRTVSFSHSDGAQLHGEVANARCSGIAQGWRTAGQWNFWKVSGTIWKALSRTLYYRRGHAVPGPSDLNLLAFDNASGNHGDGSGNGSAVAEQPRVGGNHSSPSGLLAAVQPAAAIACSGNPALRSYPRRNRLCTIRIKIYRAHPELIEAGYRERIAEVVAASGQQLQGLYVQRGCIELIVDTCATDAPAPLQHLHTSSHAAAATSSLALAAEAQAYAEAHIAILRGLPDVDRIVQALQLPLSEQPRSHSALVWLPDGTELVVGPVESGTAAREAVPARPSGAAAEACAPVPLPTLSVRPIVVCTAGAASSAAAEQQPTTSNEASVVVHVWVPVAPDAAATAPKPPRLSVRTAGVSLPVIVEWDGAREQAAEAEAEGFGWITASDQSLSAAAVSPSNLLSGCEVNKEDPVALPARSTDASQALSQTTVAAGRGVEAGGNNGSGSSAALRRCEGYLFSGTCRIQDLPAGGQGVLLLQAQCEEDESAVAEPLPCLTRPVPFLLVDDPRVAEEVLRSGGMTEDPSDVHDFIVDLGTFLGGAAHWATSTAAAALPGTGAAVQVLPRMQLLELQELGCHMDEWLSQSGGGEDCWPGTLARLRRDVAIISDLVGQREILIPASNPGQGGCDQAAQDGAVSGGRGSVGLDPQVADCGSRGGVDSHPAGWPGALRPSAVARPREAGERGGSTRAAIPPPVGCSVGSAALTPVTAAERRRLEAPAYGGTGTPLAGRRDWFRSWAMAWTSAQSLYDSLQEAGYQDFLTEYCAMQAPVLDVMFFTSIGTVVLRCWQEDPAWRHRPLSSFLAHLTPCVVTLTPSVLSTVMRPLLPGPSWARLARTCMVLRSLTFLLGLGLMGAGSPVPSAIIGYHQRGLSVMLGEGVVLSATLVIMPFNALVLAMIRIPAHVAVWIRVGAYDTATAALPYAVFLAGCSVAVNVLLHVILMTQYRRRARRLARSKTE